MSTRGEFARFLVAGGIAAFANFGSRILFDLALPYVPSIVLAYLVGMATAFLLNRAFVFPQARNRLEHQVLWFALVNVGALAQTLVVSVLLARQVFPWAGMHFHADTVAHLVGVIVPVFTSFVGHRRLTFRPPG